MGTTTLFRGSPAATQISGGAGNDLLRHFGPLPQGRSAFGDDTFTGGAGNDTIEGGPLHDVAVYSGARSSYSLSLGATGWTIVDNRPSSPDGTDTVRSVETIRFSDGNFIARHTTTIDDTVAAAVHTILREDASGSDATDLAQELSYEVATGGNIDSAVSDLVVAARSTASVATIAYQFFTGSTPSAAGMDYLVSSTGPNPNNLDSTYYQSFSTENRYINFAVNLGKAGAGHAQFEAQYGGLNLFEATKQAYATIFGGEPPDAKVHALLDPSVDLSGVTMTRAQYFASYGADGPDGLGTKAAMVGWLLTEAVKADLGTYAKANDAYLADLALHDAPFAIDMIGHYAQPGFAFQPG
jgi:serralysin